MPYTDTSGNKRIYKKSFNEKNYISKAKALSEAKKHRDMIKVEISVNRLVEASDKTIMDVFKLYNTTSLISSETIRKRTIFLGKYIAPFIPLTTKFEKITAVDISMTLNQAKSIATDGTIKHVFSLWKGLYKTAIMNEILNIDQTMKITRPKSLVPTKAKRSQVTNLETIDEVIIALNGAAHS